MPRNCWKSFPLLVVLMVSFKSVASNLEYRRTKGDECESGQLCRPPTMARERCTTKDEFKLFLNETCHGAEKRVTCQKKLVHEVALKMNIKPEEVKAGLRLTWLDDECKSGKCVLEIIDEVGWGVCAAGTKNPFLYVIMGQVDESQEPNGNIVSQSKMNNNDEFDEVLALAGSNGKYQRILLYLVLGPIIMFQPVLTLNAIFMLEQPDHYCNVPMNENFTDLKAWKNLTIPMELGPDDMPRYSQCEMYSDTKDSNRTIVPCKYGWTYDKSNYDETISSLNNWVCDHDHYGSDALTLYAAGNAVGAIVFGWAADRYGRKPIFFLTVFINTFFRGVSMFVHQDFFLFLGIQFLVGIAFPIMYILPCMIVAEISDPEHRGFIYAFTWVIWVVGMASLPLIAWLARHWFLIGVITTAPGIFLFIYWKWLPESPRWLVSVGKIKEAISIVHHIAKVNGKSDTINDNYVESVLKKLLLKKEIERSKTLGIWSLFSKCKIGLNTIMVTISWSMNGLLYYAITLNAGKMSGNPFLNFFLLAIIEVPAGWLGGYLVDRIGRRWVQVGFFGIGIVAFIGAAIASLHPGLTIAVIACIIVAKFCITLTFLVVYLQGAEIFPTILRSTGTGLASTVASAIGVAAPYLIFIGKFSASLPYISMALLALIGIFASIFLPETLNITLPETIEEANDIGRGAKFWSFLPNSRSSGETENSRNKNSPL